MTPQNDLFVIENAVSLLVQETGVPIYDFNFRNWFACQSLWPGHTTRKVIARLGAFSDYAKQSDDLRSQGIELIHSEQDHLRATRLPVWYHLIADLTPRSKWYSELPTADQIEEDFRWPVFIKGERQTSLHSQSLSVAKSRENYDWLIDQYATDSILRWQSVVVREFIALRRVEEAYGDRVPSSYEFRTFWWRGELVGSGRYWYQGKGYEWTSNEKQAAIAVADIAAKRINIPFLVIDLAMTLDGQWIVIECNDGQESGYAGVSPIGLWQSIVACEQRMRMD
ncbi:ATP-grasp domain-containing protein [Lacunimicrobium album]